MAVSLERLAKEDGSPMASRGPAGQVCNRITLAVEDRSCPVWGRDMHGCAHRDHHLWTLQGATQVINRLGRGPAPACERRGRTGSPAAALSLRLPRWGLGGEVCCWLGPRRFGRQGSVPPRRLECHAPHRVRWSDEASETDMGRSHTRRTARQHDPAPRAEASRAMGALGLTRDGLQPEKGHATLSVVRELRCQRVGWAAPWLASATQAGRRWSLLARQWAEHVGTPVRAWMSDPQDACVTAMADEVGGVPHRYCPNPLRRDVAPPVRARDRPAKGKRRSNGRGLRASERRVLAERRHAAPPEPPLFPERPQGDGPPWIAPSEAATAAPWAPGARSGATPGTAPGEDEAGEGVRGYGAAVRGLLQASHGGPRRPPGGRMREAVPAVRDALARHLQAHKGELQSRS